MESGRRRVRRSKYEIVMGLIKLCVGYINALSGKPIKIRRDSANKKKELCPTLHLVLKNTYSKIFVATMISRTRQLVSQVRAIGSKGTYIAKTSTYTGSTIVSDAVTGSAMQTHSAHSSMHPSSTEHFAAQTMAITSPLQIYDVNHPSYYNMVSASYGTFDTAP